MLDCWLRDPSARPTFGELRNRLLEDLDIEFKETRSPSPYSIVSSIVNIIIDGVVSRSGTSSTISRR